MAVLVCARFWRVGPEAGSFLLMTDFILDLATLKPTFDLVEVEAPARDVGLPDSEWRGDIRAAFRVERSGSRVSVRGMLRSTVQLACVRCLKEFDVDVEVAYSVFADQSGKSARDEEDQLKRDDYMLFHDGRRLDLRESVRETLLLELPISPHCREDCPGLCPKCGSDLNLGPCGCTV